MSEAHALHAIVGGELVVTAPDGHAIRLQYQRHIEHPDGNWTWIGREPGAAPGQEAILTFGQKAVFGSIPNGNKEALRVMMAGGHTWLVETDGAAVARMASTGVHPRGTDALLPPRVFGADRAEQSAPTPAQAVPEAASATAGPTIDVVLGYTAQFATRLGGSSQAVTRLTYLVDVTNQAYANSDIVGHVRLVGTAQVDYADATPNRDALYALSGVSCTQDSGGGQSCVEAPVPAGLQPLLTAREQYGADLASLVRVFNDPENGNCGIAWLIGGGQTAFDATDADSGLSVVSDSSGNAYPDGGYICRDETLAHELAHNMGSTHDADTADGDDNVLQANEYGRYPYSFGYKTSTAGNFYTVMAYGDAGQSRLRVFSNPRLNICNGYACGIVGQADNASSLNQTMPVVAGFRATVVGGARRNPHADLNGDGRSDIVWRNTSMGLMAHWWMNGPSRIAEKTWGVASIYRIVGNGDFDGDGRSDLLWTNDANDLLWIWRSRGDGAYDVLSVGSYGPNRRVAGVVDLNGDGRDDIVWRHGDLGEMSYWLMVGAAKTQGPMFSVGAQYRVVGTGDFDGDGHGDLLWTNATNDLLWIWRGRTDGAFDVQFVNGLPPGWQVAGVTDLNGDGKSDIVFRNENQGLIAHWWMNGNAQIAERAHAVASIYHIVGTGDFDGDALGDLLWSNDANDLTWIWRSAGDGSYQVQFVDGNPPGWTIQNRY